MPAALKTSPARSPSRRYSVFACDEGRQRAHTVIGESYEDAAIGFVEVWHPALDAAGEVDLVVIDCETGREQCLRVDIGDGAVEPCAGQNAIRSD